jgi:primosomal replication protein N
VKRMILGAVATIILSGQTNAAWFARLDSASNLVVTGFATDSGGLSSMVTLTCKAAKFGIEISTNMNAGKEDLPLYAGNKIVLSYKTEDGEVRKLGVEGTPTQVGGGLSFRSSLSSEQSQAIYRSIGKGYRLDVELVHPELATESGVKQVFSEGFVRALLAIQEHCGGFA